MIYFCCGLDEKKKKKPNKEERIREKIGRVSLFHTFSNVDQRKKKKKNQNL